MHQLEAPRHYEWHDCEPFGEVHYCFRLPTEQPLIEVIRVLIFGNMTQVRQPPWLTVDNCVKLDARGRVITDGHFATNAAGIYGIGDCREGAMLAHKAEDEAVACAERIAGKAGHVSPAWRFPWRKLAVPGVALAAQEP